MAEFVFATCLPGMEPALKLDVARLRPALRFAYSRPGLVTFKSAEPVAPDDGPASPLARVWGRSLGAARTIDEAAALLGAFSITRTHVFAREDTADLEPWLALGPATNTAASDSDLVADVIVAPPGEPAWIGVHRHTAQCSPHAGGAFPVAVPDDSPSRAFAKIEEAIAWAGLPVAAGDVALEIGAAPGGALLALARRGVTVYGVDSAELAPVVRARPEVHHLQLKVGALRWEQLPPRVDWLLVDVNLAPQVALHEVARLMPPLAKTLRGAVFTLKLNDLDVVAELPALVDRIRGLGFSRVALRHLPSNRREICAVALP